MHIPSAMIVVLTSDCADRDGCGEGVPVASQSLHLTRKGMVLLSITRPYVGVTAGELR